MNDPVNHPKHYTEHPSGIECITVVEHMGFCLGNAIKYIWRADLKNGVEDLKSRLVSAARDREAREGREMRATIVLPGLKTVSLTNQREHWRSRSARAKSQRRAVAAAWPRGTWNTDQLPVGSVLVVVLTRISPRDLDDDNLRGALKSVRDQVAACLYLDDRDKRFVWLYAQEKGPLGVRIEIEEVGAKEIEAKFIARARSLAGFFP